MIASTPQQLRELVAAGEWRQPTAGLLDDFQQANLVIVPRALAWDLLLFCVRNPKVCPLLAVGEPGEYLLHVGNTTVDVRRMLPRYRVWHAGQLVAEPYDLEDHWREDAVAFLLGCSHTFDGPLRRAGIPVSHQAPPVYITNIPCVSAGQIRGPMAVSMRPVHHSKIAVATGVTARYASGHGMPVHYGSPAEIGITDLSQPDFGVYPGLEEGYVPVFWACGVTPQIVLPPLQPEWMCSHYPGHMLVLDDSVDFFSLQQG